MLFFENRVFLRGVFYGISVLRLLINFIGDAHYAFLVVLRLTEYIIYKRRIKFQMKKCKEIDMRREYRPFYIRDNATALCWTAANPHVVNTSFSLRTCATSYPPPANQFFMSVMKYSSLSPQFSWPDNTRMTVLGSSIGNTEWNSVRNPNSLCLTFLKNKLSTVKCGNNGTFAFDSAFGNTCYGPNAVDGKTIVAYPCPSVRTTVLVQYTASYTGEQTFN